LVVIAVSGPPGSGKTTQAKRLAEYFNLRYFSAGQVFREIARERGVSLEELSIQAMHDPTIDLEIDRRTYVEALKGNVVLDGHLTAWVVRGLADISIYFTAPLSVRVARIAERDHLDYYTALRQTVIREHTQWKRFMEYYGIDVNDLSFFDIIVNVEKIGIDDVFEIIKSRVEKVLKSK